MHNQWQARKFLRLTARRKFFSLAIVFIIAQVSGLAQANLRFAPEGHWLQKCQLIGDDWLQSSLNFESKGQSLTWVRVAFEEDNCTKPYLIYELVYDGIVLSEASPNSIDLRLLEVAYTPLSSEVAEALNLIAFCGLTQWQSGHRELVTGMKCEDLHQPQAQSMYYTELYLETESTKHLLPSNSSEPRLLWGQATELKNGSTPELRTNIFEADAYLSAPSSQNLKNR